MAVALEAHDALLRAAVEQAGGTVVKTTSDWMLAAFDRAEAALTAARACVSHTRSPGGECVGPVSRSLS
jgi:class 3 adenylate cyclase